MSVPKQHKLAILNTLIRTCRDSELGYQTAADDVRFKAYRQLFESYAQQRAEFAVQLQAEVERLGGNPEETGSMMGRLHRGWMEIKATLTNEAGAAMLAECERGEALALEQYELALKEEWPPQTRSLISHQKETIEQVYNHIQQLQEGLMVQANESS